MILKQSRAGLKKNAKRLFENHWTKKMPKRLFEKSLANFFLPRDCFFSDWTKKMPKETVFFRLDHFFFGRDCHESNLENHWEHQTSVSHTVLSIVILGFRLRGGGTLI